MNLLSELLESFTGLVVRHPFSIWIQISSFSFFLAGNFSDLLIVRLCLSTSYVFLFLNSALGSPLWPNWHNPGQIQLDGICWAGLNIYVHVSTVVRLIRDERSVPLQPETLALWRLFYRIGGLSQMLFQQLVARHCTVVKHMERDELDTQKNFYIIYKGVIQLTMTMKEGNVLISSRKAHSGQLFDFRSLGLLKDYEMMDKHVLHAKVCSSQGAVLFCFPQPKMTQIAQYPATRLIWKELLMENLLRIVRRYFIKQVQGGVGYSNNYVNPLYAPLEPSEQPHPLRAGSGVALLNPVAHVLASMKWSFSPPWPFGGTPLGLRHSQLLPQQPSTGKPAPKHQQQESLPATILNVNEETKPLLSAKEHSKSDSTLNRNWGNLEHRNSDSALYVADSSYMSVMNGSSVSQEQRLNKKEDEIFFNYLDCFDEKEIGGLHLLNFKKFPSKY